jgi:hypothetical protein
VLIREAGRLCHSGTETEYACRVFITFLSIYQRGAEAEGMRLVLSQEEPNRSLTLSSFPAFVKVHGSYVFAASASLGSPGSDVALPRCPYTKLEGF